MSSTFAVGGLASGLDTKSIISQLMSLEERPLSLVQGRQTAHTSKMAAIQAIKDQISSLQSAVKSLADRTKINAKVATTDTAFGSPSVVNASATADAINGTFKVTVSQLATSTRVASGSPIGTVIDANATLASAGFRFSNIQGLFRLNGQSITVDGTTTLNSLMTSINGSGAGVTASLVADADGRADNRVQLISAPGQTINLGSLSDTANTLRMLNLSDAAVSGYTASSTNSGMAASAGALNTSMTINGVTTAINQGNAGATSADNAQFIAQAINDDANSKVTAAAQGDGTITLTQKTTGSQQAIDITAAGTGTGLNVALTKNGTDRVVSTTSLGVTNVGASLSSARMNTPIGGLDGGGNGSFKINDVEITYKSTDSITSIMNRINASSSGVSAFYDPVQDRIRLSASQTGARTMTLEDTQGNFLAATGVLNATQQLGQNAIFSIDSVNNGQALSSSTNSVTGYIPGVTLDLKSTSATPVTVTVAQDSNTTISNIKAFVTQYNTAMQKIDDLTKYNATTKKAAALTGDSGIRDMQRQLRQMVSGAAIGASGTYRNLASLGISFGAVGSALGATTKLTVDDAKLSKAVAENPQAVEAVLAGFAATIGTPTTTNITSVTGTPQMHQDGEYRIKVTNASTGEVEAKFVTTDGRTVWTGVGTMAAGQDNYSVIPGLKVTAAAVLTDGAEDTFSISVTNKGVGVALSDFVNNLTDLTGYFANRKKGDDSITAGYSKRIADMQDRLDRKQASLEKKYAALEVAMSKLQSQSSALSAQIMKLNAAQ
jgi:flagellar hook-associated protein 2